MGLQIVGVDYEIQYKQGSDNQVVDTLCKIPIDEHSQSSSMFLSTIFYPY